MLSLAIWILAVWPPKPQLRLETFEYWTFGRGGVVEKRRAVREVIVYSFEVKPVSGANK